MAGCPQIATTTITPPGRMASNRVSSTTFTELHSKATSAPDPPLSRLTSSTTSTSAGFSAWSATPVSKAFCRRSSLGSLMITVSPLALRTAAVSRPMGPAPPIRAMSPDFAPLRTKA